jgi:solute carrier family 25 (peroxisomal adenine nucleotide transporter), member 17
MEKRRNHWVLLWTRKRLGRNDDVKVRPPPAIVQPTSSTNTHLSFIYFYLYSFLRTKLLKRKSVGDEKAKLTAMLSIPEELLIGLVSGIGSKVITTPLSVITVHLQTDKHDNEVDLEKQESATSNLEGKQSNFMRVVKRIYSESGLAGFWRGKHI